MNAIPLNMVGPGKATLFNYSQLSIDWGYNSIYRPKAFYLRYRMIRLTNKSPITLTALHISNEWAIYMFRVPLIVNLLNLGGKYPSGVQISIGTYCMVLRPPVIVWRTIILSLTSFCNHIYNCRVLVNQFDVKCCLGFILCEDIYCDVHHLPNCFSWFVYSRIFSVVAWLTDVLRLHSFTSLAI